MRSQNLFIVILSSLLWLTACSDRKDSTISNTSSSGTEAEIIETDKWRGKWHGPEGTFIEIAGTNGNYDITIQDLDGPKKFQGTSKSNQIIFERDGKTEILEASNGVDTGMKWLSEKTNCLRTKPGEGWCRD